MTTQFDGHANCFIESGHGKGLLIDFNYDTEPLTGKYPVPGDRPVHPARGEPRQPPGGSSASAGRTGTCCCPAARCPCRP